LFSAVGAGVGVAAVLVLLIGNQFTQRALTDTRPAQGSAWAAVVGALRFAAFDFSQAGGALLAWLLTVLIYLAVLFALLLAGTPGLRAAAGFGGVVFGWGATMLAAAAGAGFATLLGYDLVPDVVLGRTGAAVANAFVGAAYGLVVGWLVGLATVLGSSSSGGGWRR
jgi:hypothetical protein